MRIRYMCVDICVHTQYTRGFPFICMHTYTHASHPQKTLDKIEAQMERQKARAEFNFENPTPQMIEDAKKQGIDLTDKDVLHYLQTLQQRRENGESIEDFDSRDEAFMQSQADAENKKSGKRGNVNENGNSKEGGVSRETQTIIAVVMLVFVFYRLASMGLLMPILEYVFGVNSLSMQGEGVEEGDVDDMEDDGGEGAW